MDRFLLLASMVTGITGIATQHQKSSDPLQVRNDALGNQFLSLHLRDFLDGDAEDDSLWLDTGEGIDSASDSLFFPQSDDLALSTMPFDEASADECDGSESSMDPFTDFSDLDARDLIDDFPGLQDLTTPLQDLTTPSDSCSAFTRRKKKNSNQQGPPLVTGGDPLSELRPVIPSSSESEGGCPPGYPHALCCTGIREDPNIYGCVLCECLLLCSPVTMNRW